jgi:mannose-6-phosphate isomerase-like protein (cupin superfamily)
MKALLFLAAVSAFAADPTYLKRTVSAIQPVEGYRPIFGAGDPDARQLKSIARYGELTVAPGDASPAVSYSAEEQIYFVLEGRGAVSYDGARSPIRANDFLYLPPGVKHGVVNDSSAPLRLLVMGFRIPRTVTVTLPPRLMIANTEDVPPVEVAGHGPTVRFKLLMGTTASTRDALPAASQMVSLFIMEFAPGGTNIPHHHESEEEIYFLLRGSGEMIAGEGQYPAKAGDAFFFRLNANVGFYSRAREGQPKDLILAVRSTFPRR